MISNPSARSLAPIRCLSLVFLVLAAVGSASAHGATATIRWICTTETQCWQDMTVVGSEVSAAVPVLTVDPSVKYQTIIGFGGCFNELAWQALEGVPPEVRNEALKALFDRAGCNFTTCRVGIGANDFALRWYSLDETAGDLQMDHFNLDEDRKTLIPYIKAAMQIQPKLALWGVPWSPPAWMKTNGSYKGGKDSHLNQEPEILEAYALYFSKYVQAYRAEGLPIQGIFPQNEPHEFSSSYPQCGWTADELNGFIRDHLVPRLRKDQVQVEVWLGTLSNYDEKKGMDEFINPILGDPATNPMLTGLGGQYGTQNLFQQTHDKYPDKKILETETECHHGANSWGEAMEMFGRVVDDLNHFANGYMYWNMILGEKATSTWGWHQNSLLIVDSHSKKISYNPEFYVMKYFGNVIQPGAVRVGISAAPFSKITAFQNPGGSVAVLFSNDSKSEIKVSLSIGGILVPIYAPPASMNAVVVSP